MADIQIQRKHGLGLPKARKIAFRWAENDMRHWLILLAADRVNVVEGIGEDYVPKNCELDLIKKAYIIDDPSEQYIVQASTKSAITSSMIGLNVGITYNTTTGNTTTGYSNVTVESTSITSSNSQPFRIVDFYSAYAPGGAGLNNVNFGSSTVNVVNGLDNSNPANIIVVRLNNCDRLNLTARSS